MVMHAVPFEVLESDVCNVLMHIRNHACMQRCMYIQANFYTVHKPTYIHANM